MVISMKAAPRNNYNLQCMSKCGSCCQENLLDPTGSTVMPPLGLKIYLWPRVTLIFDLLTFKVDSFVSLPPWSTCAK